MKSVEPQIPDQGWKLKLNNFKSTLSTNKKVVLGISGLVILLIALPATVYLVQRQQNLKSSASVSAPASPETGFTLTSNLSQYGIGDTVRLQVKVRSDVDAANLFSAKINFPPNLLEVESINTDNSIVQSWVENHYDNTLGTISLVGGVPSPGYKTNTGDPAGLMATINFKVRAEGNAGITLTSGAAIYRNSDNTNILTTNYISKILLTGSSTCTGATIEPSPKTQSPQVVGTSVTFTAQLNCKTSVNPSAAPAVYGTPSPQGVIGEYKWWVQPENGKWSTVKDWSTNASYNWNTSSLKPGTYYVGVWARAVGATTYFPVSVPYTLELAPGASPSASPVVTKGDANNDGKIDLADLSILLSNFGSSSGFPAAIDLNDDGTINAFDVSLMRNTLIYNGIIH